VSFGILITIYEIPTMNYGGCAIFDTSAVYFWGFKIGAVKERAKLASNITPVFFSALFL